MRQLIIETQDYAHLKNKIVFQLLNNEQLSLFFAVRHKKTFLLSHALQASLRLG
jgi:hypothetical protein